MTYVKFTPFRVIADRDYGVKCFEIRFQGMIERYLLENGISAPWWYYYEGPIFWELWELYKESAEDSMILANLYLYYCKVTKEVARRVRDNDPVKKPS